MTKQFRGKMFASLSDPQVTLQQLRSLTVSGSEGEHKKMWLQLNTSAYVDSYVNARQNTSAPWSEALKVQILLMVETYYEAIVQGGPVPVFDPSKIRAMSMMPLPLVVKLNLVGRLREDPGAGGREEALATKRAAEKAKKNSKKKARLATPGPGPEGGLGTSSTLNVNGKAFKTKKDGTVALKPGRKAGSTRNADGTIQGPPGSAKKPVATNVHSANSAAGARASSFADTGHAAHAVAVLDTALVRELQMSNAAKDAKIAELTAALLADNSEAKNKDERLRSEMRNRGNIAKMAGGGGSMDPEVIEGYFHVVSPLKLTGPPRN